MVERHGAGLFSVLLRHWRTRRGLSQLDLALAADVSSRHVSFLETGRAKPSREMVLRLGATLGVPLRDQNVMLGAAGFGAEFDQDGEGPGLPPAVEQAIGRMMRQQEPFPLVVMDRAYDVVRSNEGATRLLAAMVADPAALAPPVNAFRIVFDPRLCRPFITDWERTARLLVSRLHREALERPTDEGLAALIGSLFEYPGVPRSFRQPDFSAPSEPTLTVRMRRDDLELAFLTTLTVFNAPQSVALEDLRIESYFPLDDATERACRALAAAAS
ncbi:MAG TPA: helix-turn-helix transcriptional regulator [Polyangiaceae bacterium]|nr:helix-turn-helix transcriptional regulator [Polyangiaceae bacterium]